jgi:hypothetical protein
VRKPTTEIVVAAAERSTQRRPRLGPDATRLLIEALWCLLPPIDIGGIVVRRELTTIAELLAWFRHSARNEQELRGLLVELAVAAAAGEPSLLDRWLEALGVDPEAGEARAA